MLLFYILYYTEIHILTNKITDQIYDNKINQQAGLLTVENKSQSKNRPSD